ncbi:hypothetical protein GD627_09460 [Arthrobacter yangruifuii]|uniref:DUF6966 domain-containing protein n=1 Tax=Arthrobacter yangruifuii TaxID=2606616 RepID=A0A5N6MHM4_9MICC|nr:hypothetical protein [Arthrobacter yangruifuii]KAD3633060.1 hypothetical protein GD627_09460 [Arthrobacter yangruifuii]
MTSRMAQRAADLAMLLGRYGYESEERYFKSVRASLARAEGDPDALKDVSRSILSAYRGMGSLNDLVIMADGQVDMSANDELTLLLRQLRTTAIELATGGPLR